MSLRRTLTALGAAALGLSLLLLAQGADAATYRNGAWFSYVSGQQTTDANGAGVTMMQATPYVASAQGHSLQELSVQDANQQSTVEVGWTVDPQVNGDYLPHLFVFHWVDGQVSCYNGCGFVPATGTSARPGMAVTSGAAATYQIDHDAGTQAWWIYYNGQAVGDFPDSLWQDPTTHADTFTRAQLVSAFGEVADPDPVSRSWMGNGSCGSWSDSSAISGYQLYGSADQPNLTVRATDPGSYNSGSATATSFQLGGSGSGTC
ncbi:hypothetical protein P3T36_000974 [Kitasatospora sp. MAP12-15]|uniref:neprosin family prolyl endopeptidase n=1 Tax=unclassified Kitasatospora TaxID=2633591 RepID=UPI0024735E5F|nr:neprosin family prolyl endopeptidase [Kitasatospora sp. MAP12-44]MDH6114575.1 hypothetical protein [Kitasatospora sp. MAP12-44]